MDENQMQEIIDALRSQLDSCRAELQASRAVVAESVAEIDRLRHAS
jgi:predicted P-loop ATPase/GTPase